MLLGGRSWCCRATEGSCAPREYAFGASETCCGLRPLDLNLRPARSESGPKSLFPVLPNEQTRARQGLSLRVRERTSSRVEVMLWEEDTGYQVVYVFERNTCWMLVLIDDQSV